MCPDEPSWVSVSYLPLPTGSAAADTANLNTVLARGGTIRPNPLVVAPNYQLNAPLVLAPGGNTDVDFGAAVFTLTTQNNMLQNAAVQPVVTATDVATTATSAVVTSATLAARAVVGQQLAVVGAGPAGGDGGGAIWLYGTVLSIAGNNITLTSNNVNGIAATNTLAGATGYLFNRDSNITLRGGTWNAATIWNGGSGIRNAAGFNTHLIRLRRIDNFTIRDIALKQVGFPAGGGWCFGIAIGDVTNGLIDNCSGYACSTVVQGDGPLNTITVRDSWGSVQDDMVSFGCVGFQGNDLEGDIVDVTVDGIQGQNAWRGSKWFSGTGSNGAQRIISGATTRGVKGTFQNEPVSVIEYAGTTWFDGIIEDITAVPGAGHAQVYISAAQAQTVFVNNVKWPARAGTPPGAVATGRPVANLIIRNLDLRAASGTAVGVLLSDGGGAGVGTYNEVTLDGFTAPDTGPIVQAVKLTTNRPANRIAVKNFRVTGAASSSLIYNNNLSVIGEIEIADGRMDGGGNAALYYNDATSANPVTLKISRAYLLSTLAGGVATLAHPATVILADCEFSLTGAAVRANAANATPVRILGQNLRFPGTSGVLLTRSATQTVSVSSLQGTVDQTILTPSDGDVFYNSNAAPLNGVGLAIYNSAAVKIKNIYSGTTN